MLKQMPMRKYDFAGSQPPSGGCVLKLIPLVEHIEQSLQPPSGGCVLKHYVNIGIIVCDGSSRLQAAVC